MYPYFQVLLTIHHNRCLEQSPSDDLTAALKFDAITYYVITL